MTARVVRGGRYWDDQTPLGSEIPDWPGFGLFRGLEEDGTRIWAGVTRTRRPRTPIGIFRLRTSSEVEWDEMELRMGGSHRSSVRYRPPARATFRRGLTDRASLVWRRTHKRASGVCPGLFCL